MPFSSTLANTILATPFDDRTAAAPEISKKLTEKEFLENCYSHPIFSKAYKQEVKMKIEGVELSEETANEIASITTKDYEDQSARMEKSYEFFINWKNSFEANKVYTINGNAGTGKTTFINHSRYYDTDVQWVILDVYFSKEYVDWISDIRTTINNFERADSKIYGSIIRKIWDIVFQGNDKNGVYDIKNVDSNLTKLIHAYKSRFSGKLPVGRVVLDDLKKSTFLKLTVESRVKAAAKVFRKHLNGNVNNNREGIVEALNLLLLILKCMNNDPDKKYIIVFDNLERFIEKDELYNKDVDDIRKFLRSYIDNINQTNTYLNNTFKFAMAVRNSTARICHVRVHASDAEASCLDLSEWYDINNIISKKMDWYKMHGIQVDDAKLLMQIVSDLRKCQDNTLTGLQLMINPLFNDNKRLILDFIGSMIELPSNQEGLTKYQELWNKDTPQSRFAARSIIRGMILQYFEKIHDRFFERLGTYGSSDKSKNGIGYARKILTLLYNNIQADHDNELPLANILSILLNTDAMEGWNSPEFADQRRQICEVLFFMNSYNRRENDWIQFIDIQINNSSKSISVTEAWQLEELIQTRMNNFVLHLMPGGQAYLKFIVHTFEFFSFRYTDDYTPLFSQIPSYDDFEACKDVKQLKCYRIMAKAIRSAVSCIGLLHKGEDNLKISFGKRNRIGVSHAERIANQHKGYIRVFSELVHSEVTESKKYSGQADIAQKLLLFDNELRKLSSQYDIKVTTTCEE